MPGFGRFKDVVDAEVINGSSRFNAWRKTPTQATTIGIWFDLSSSPGNPPPKYWFDSAPLVAKQVAQSTDGGFWHGSNVSPANKYLTEMMAMCVTAAPLPMPIIICDYLLYYPTIDDSVAGEQDMDNTITLPRYTSGAGVQILALSTATRVGGQTINISYTNSNGVSGRQTQTVIENAVSVTGSVVSSDRAVNGASGPFMPLQTGDSGVQSVQSVTMPGNDVGLFSLVLVKPLAQLSIRGVDAPVEVSYVKDFMVLPQIYDDAYLSAICLPQGSLSGASIFGSIKTVFK